mgnify:CR=1 FL=1
MIAVRNEDEEKEEEGKRRCMLGGATGNRKASVGTMITTESERKATRENRLAIQPAGGHIDFRLNKQQQQLESRMIWMPAPRRKPRLRSLWSLRGWKM